MNADLMQQLRALKLPGIREHLEARIVEAEGNSLSYHEFLSMLLTDEIDQRATRRIQRLLRSAQLGPETTLETFDWTFNPTINAKLIRGLAGCRFLERGEGIFLIGPTGTGKTHLAKAIAHAACRLMFTVSYHTFNGLLAELARADLHNKLHLSMKRLLAVDLLVIDDFGLKTIDQISAERLYAIVDGRFHAKSIIFTSNRALTDWPGFFPDPIIANAILDRIAHTSHQIILKGHSYRKKLQVNTEQEEETNHKPNKKESGSAKR